MAGFLRLSGYGLLTCISLVSCGENVSYSGQRTSASADTCDNPDADINCSFSEMPAELGSIMKIAGNNEPGEKLIISGTIYKSDGVTPYPGLVLYAYHTDKAGYYSKKGNEKGVRKWHGYLHGWCRTDASGRYSIHTIRPGRYPANTMPAHIHTAIKDPGAKEAFYINDFVFRDDSLVNDKYLSSLRLPGGTGVVEVIRSGGTWYGKRDIVLDLMNSR